MRLFRLAALDGALETSPARCSHTVRPLSVTGLLGNDQIRAAIQWDRRARGRGSQGLSLSVQQCCAIEPVVINHNGSGCNPANLQVYLQSHRRAQHSQEREREA